MIWPTAIRAASSRQWPDHGWGAWLEMSADKVQGAQTLERGIDVLMALSGTPLSLDELAAAVGLSRSTAYRLATVLVTRGLVKMAPREGYSLGFELIRLGDQAQRSLHLSSLARPHLEKLASDTRDTVHLGVLDGDEVLYLAKIPGRRRIEIMTSVGERNPLRSTGLGKALLLDSEEVHWALAYDADVPARLSPIDRTIWFERMRAYVVEGSALDIEENEDRIRCVAAPVRDVAGRIVAAISLSTAAQYMDGERMQALKPQVRATAAAVSEELGWSRPAALPARLVGTVALPA
jgi:DNA-binding IclR family transcriptional regulator